MHEWLYLFAQFTPEFLLGELCLFFLGLSVYLGFWILKKRRYGVSTPEMVLTPVQESLDQVWIQVSQLRTQLFGITHPLPSLPNSHSTLSSSLLEKPLEGSPASSETLALVQELKKQLAEKTQETQTLLTDKKKLTQQVQEAQSKPTSSSPSTESPFLQELKTKNQELTDRLQEYSVLEEDLANLKRLQQENAQLKKALEGTAPNPPSLPLVPPIEPASEKEETQESPQKTSEQPQANPQETQKKEETPLPIKPTPEEENLVAEFEKMLQQGK